VNDMSSEEAVLRQLREQTRWLRLIGLQALKPLIPAVLKTDKQRLVYELTDGQRTVRDVAGAAGVGTGTVSRLWADWITLGLCVQSGKVTGRAEHLTSLAALGYDIPVTEGRRGEPPGDGVEQLFSGDKEASEPITEEASDRGNRRS